MKARDVAWILWVYLLVLAVVFAIVTWAAPETVDRRMPQVSGYKLDNGAHMGTLPCGEAYMEVRRTKVPNEWVVVWYLNKKVLAVVFVYDGYYQYFVDSDFDGRWNKNGIGKTGEGSAADFYKLVNGCYLTT
jgi:hypothetical protein